MKIGKIHLKYDGDIAKEHEIHYKSQVGFSVKGLPAEFAELTGFKTVAFSTEALLRSELEEACRKYRHLKTCSKMVILYKCRATTDISCNKIGKGQYSGRLKGVSKNIGGMHVAGAGMVIEYELATVVDDGVRKKYFKMDEDTMEVSSWVMDKASEYQEIEYTEERWMFFLSITEAMKQMLVNLSKFFDANSDDAVMMIESKMKFLN